MKKITLLAALYLTLFASSSLVQGQNNLYLGPYSGSSAIIGRLSVSGSSAELSLLNRQVNSFIESPTSGDRWSIYNDGNLKFWTGADKMVLTKEGNLFIGPAVSTYSGSGRLSLSGNTAEVILNNRSVTSFIDSPTQGERWSIYNEGPMTDGKLRFWTGSDKVVFTKEGRVGIGTSNPDRELTVNGNIHAKEVLIDLNIPAPDYVFEADYNLMDLEELKRYIEKNKHLPEIPSNKEFQTNGMEVSALSMALLKKIEELTLYQIQLLNQIAEINDKILKLEEKLTK